jgi:hypothetical protein
MPGNEFIKRRRINPKFEIRNSKQIAMFKKQKIQNDPVSDFDIRIADFVIELRRQFHGVA